MGKFVETDQFMHFDGIMQGAPVEIKGYKSVLKLSEWQTNH
jgi:hypothetical protein